MGADTWKWLLSILIGAVMGLLAFLVDAGIDGMNGFKFDAVRRTIAAKGVRAAGQRAARASAAAAARGRACLHMLRCGVGAARRRWSHWPGLPGAPYRVPRLLSTDPLN